MLHSSPLSGHMGVDKTLRRAKKDFFWVGMKTDIKKFIGSCDSCMRNKHHRVFEPEARIWPVAPRKFYRVHMDLVGPFPENGTGYKYICVFVDTLSRYTVLRAIPDKSAVSVAGALEYFVTKCGCPKILISDNGLEFVNSVIREATRIMGSEFYQVRAYRPSANGLVESHNKSIGQILRTLLDSERGDWVRILNTTEFALNSAHNRSVGESPFKIVFGQDPVLPSSVINEDFDRKFSSYSELVGFLHDRSREIFDRVSEVLRRSNEIYRKEFNDRNKARDNIIKVGDRVYVKRKQVRSNKLQSLFTGPFRVMEIMKGSARLLNLRNNKEYIYHQSLMAKTGVECELLNAKSDGMGDLEDLNEVFYKNIVSNDVLSTFGIREGSDRSGEI